MPSRRAPASREEHARLAPAPLHHPGRGPALRGWGGGALPATVRPAAARSWAGPQSCAQRAAARRPRGDTGRTRPAWPAGSGRFAGRESRPAWPGLGASPPRAGTSRPQAVARGGFPPLCAKGGGQTASGGAPLVPARAAPAFGWRARGARRPQWAAARRTKAGDLLQGGRGRGGAERSVRPSAGPPPPGRARSECSGRTRARQQPGRRVAGERPQPPAAVTGGGGPGDPMIRRLRTRVPIASPTVTIFRSGRPAPGPCATTSLPGDRAMSDQTGRELAGTTATQAQVFGDVRRAVTGLRVGCGRRWPF